LKKKHPDMSDAWCAQQIAKGELRHARSAETIRERIKP
jgi:hypothetical protein